MRTNALRDLERFKTGINVLVLAIRGDIDVNNSKLKAVTDPMKECWENVIQVVTEMNTNSEDSSLRNTREVKLTAFYDQFTCLLPILTRINAYNNEKMIKVISILEKKLGKLDETQPKMTPKQV